MSYRAFKRLLGETSLERKCRFLFGAATLLLIWASFTFYAKQTEDVAYEQLIATGRLLVNPVILGRHKELLLAPPGGEGDKKTKSKWEDLRKAMDKLSEEHLPKELQRYSQRLIKPNARNAQDQPTDSYESGLLQEFLADSEKKEVSRPMSNQNFIDYYSPIRANASCTVAGCHPLDNEKELYGDLKE